MKVKNIVPNDAAKEVVWLKNFITDLDVIPILSNSITLLWDNNGMIAQAKEPRSHKKSNHILWCFHLIKEIIARGNVVVKRVPLIKNIIDPLT